MRKSFTRETLHRAVGKVNYKRRGQQAVAISLALALLNLLGMVGYAAPKPTPDSTVGTITAHGVIKVNGSPAMSGQSLFSGSSIRTSTQAESTLELANLARFKLEAETSLMLESSKLGLSASLDHGTVGVFVPGGIRGAITTVDASITTDASQPVVFSVRADSCDTTVSVQTGRLEVRFGNKLKSVSAGESLSTGDAPAPPGPQQNLSGRKKAGLFLGIGGAITILLIALTGKKKVTEMPGGGGCVIILSPGGGVGGC